MKKKYIDKKEITGKKNYIKKWKLININKKDI